MQDHRNNKKPNKMKRRYQKSVLLKSKVNAAITRTDMHCTVLKWSKESERKRQGPKNEETFHHAVKIKKWNKCKQKHY